MARADRRRAAREARHARHVPTRGSERVSIESEMFFPRLRKQAKWVFVFLALVFGLGFVLFGVGSGSSGLSDLLQGNFGTLFGSNNPASGDVKDARERTEKNPNNAQAWRDLATALQNDRKPDEAIQPLERYRELRPNDEDALNELAALYLRKAEEARNRANAIQLQGEAAFAASTFQIDPSTKLGQALQGTSNPLAGYDPINRAVQQKVNEEASDAFGKMSDAFKQAVSVYRDLAALSPKDPNVQFQLAQAAEAAGDTATAVSAYKAFLKVAPDDPSAPAVRARVKQLEASSSPASAAS